MSRMYDVTVSVTLDGNDCDLTCRAFVDIEHGGSGPYAAIDGDAMALLPEGWTDVTELSLGDGDVMCIEDALMDAALEDDSSQCVEMDDEGRLSA